MPERRVPEYRLFRPQTFRRAEAARQAAGPRILDPKGRRRGALKLILRGWPNYSWKPRRDLLAQKGLSRASIYWYIEGVRFHRLQEFKQFEFNSIPPTSQINFGRWEGAFSDW